MRRLRLVAFALVAGCAHGIELENGILRKGDVALHIGPVPAEWTRVAVDGADLAYRDDSRGASVLLDARCGRGFDAPLATLTGHLIMGTTSREFETQDLVAFDGREALHTLLRAKLDGVPMHYDIYVLKKDGCVYDIVYVTPPDRFAEGSAAFERFALGLHVRTSPSRGDP